MSKKFSIIVIDDSPDDADLLMRMLRLAGFEFQAERAETAETLEKLLEAGSWDIIVNTFLFVICKVKSNLRRTCT